VKNLISKNSKAFVIAEIANTHEGNFNELKSLISQISKTGADAVKFQKFRAEELVKKENKNFQFYKKLEMTDSEWDEIINLAKNENLHVFVDVFGIQSAKTISKLKIDGFKIHSSDLTNPELLEFLKKENKPIIISTAGSTLNELEHVLMRLNLKSNQIALMHGYQGYPTQLTELNLDNITILKEKFGIPIGISDHISGNSDIATIIPLLAIALGAKIVEKHITLDRNLKHLDYQSALNPKEFTKMISLIRKTERSLKTNNFKLSKNEIKYKENHRKIAISKEKIPKNTPLKLKMFEFKRSDKKIKSIPYYDFVGKKTNKKISKGEILLQTSIKDIDKKICAVIACRIGSVRLFAKPLQKLGKYSILHLIIQQLNRSKEINDIVLAISKEPGNEIFVEFARQNKLKFIRGDDVDVLQRLIDGANYVNANTILRVTSENPFIYWEGITELVKIHFKRNNDLTHYAKLPLGSSIELIKVKALEKSHKLGTKKHHSELCTLFINENPKKFRISRILPPKYIQKTDFRLTVDTPEDLQVARKVYGVLGNNDNPIKLLKIIKFLEKNPKIKEINSDVENQHKIF